MLMFCFVNGPDKHLVEFLPSATSHHSLTKFIGHVLFLCGSPFTMGEVDIMSAGVEEKNWQLAAGSTCQWQPISNVLTLAVTNHMQWTV